MMQSCENSYTCISNDKPLPRKYTHVTTFNFSVSHPTGKIFNFYSIRNDNSYGKLIFLQDILKILGINYFSYMTKVFPTGI